MPYRAIKAIHSDANPLADEFSGKLLSENEGCFVVIGAGGILSDADAEKYGLIGSDLVEKLDEGQAARELDERNLSTVGAQEKAGLPAPVPVAVPEVEKTVSATRENAPTADKVLTSKGTQKTAKSKSRK